MLVLNSGFCWKGYDFVLCEGNIVVGDDDLDNSDDRKESKRCFWKFILDFRIGLFE